MNKILVALLVLAGACGSALSQGEYPYFIGTDYRQGSYNGGKNTAAIEQMQNDIALGAINYGAGGRLGVIVLDSGNWAITSSVTFLNYAEYIVPLGSTITVHSNTILNLNGATFWAENFPIFLGSGIVTGCMNVAISHDDGQWGGQWTNFFTGSYYVTNCAGLIGGDDLGNQILGPEHYGDNSVCSNALGTGCLHTRHYADGSVCSNAIGVGCVHDYHLSDELYNALTQPPGTNTIILFRAYPDPNVTQGPFADLALTKVNFDGGVTANFDYTGGNAGWNTNTYVFTAPVSGWYRFYAKLNCHLNPSANGFMITDDYMLMFCNAEGTQILSQSQRIEAGAGRPQKDYADLQPFHYDEFFLASNETVACYVWPDTHGDHLSLGFTEEEPANYHDSILSFFGGGLIAKYDSGTTQSSTNLPGSGGSGDTNAAAGQAQEWYATTAASAVYTGGSTFQTVTGLTFALNTTSTVVNVDTGAFTPGYATNSYTMGAFIQVKGYGSTGFTNCNYTFRITKDDVPWRQVTYQNQNPDTTNSAYLTGLIDPTDGTNVYRLSAGYDDITSGAESFQVLNSSWWMKAGF